MNFQTDDNGIYIAGSGKEVLFYPDTDYDFTFEIEDKSFWFRHRNNMILSAIKKFPFQGNFADIGGGNGLQVKFLNEQIPGKKFYLAEPAYQGCLNARKRKVEHVYNTVFQEFPFAEKAIGGIGLFDVIEHIEDDAKFLKELGKAAAKGSKVYITVPAYNWLWSDVDDYSKHFRRYDQKMIHKLAASAGLRLLLNAKFFSFLPFFSFPLRSVPYRLWGRKRKDEKILPEMLNNHKTGAVSGKIFDLLCNRELAWFSKNNISFGASCLAVMEV